MAKGRKTGGRQKGTPNKLSATLKETILEAAQKAGGENGMLGYLSVQATANPTAFLSLLGKVLPMTVAGDPDNPLQQVTEVRFSVVHPRRTDSAGI